MQRIDDSQKALMKSVDGLHAMLTKILSCLQPPMENSISDELPHLPLETKENEARLNDLLRDRGKFNKAVSNLRTDRWTQKKNYFASRSASHL